MVTDNRTNGESLSHMLINSFFKKMKINFPHFFFACYINPQENNINPGFLLVQNKKPTPEGKENILNTIENHLRDTIPPPHTANPLSHKPGVTQIILSYSVSTL